MLGARVRHQADHSVKRLFAVDRAACLRRMKCIFSMVLLCSLAAPSIAACRNPESSFEEKDCLWRESQKADRDVRQAYSAARQQVSKGMEDSGQAKEALQALSKAQKAWIIYRERDCNFEYLLNAGSNNAGQNELACKIALARRQIARLKEIRP